ncbi:hypothetical protein B5V02_06780 [Mesorhizobium kowhaii]|uniref:Uncharacterized protein n=1 Tax=Mesorhizobium kowhaii TaxID=1300272 RepID=A0A2W7CBJ1_9HYPH|nr:hypothetical protein B5V02_06780 [Mesorhizobium kowhaii]
MDRPTAAGVAPGALDRVVRRVERQIVGVRHCQLSLMRFLISIPEMLRLANAGIGVNGGYGAFSQS